MHRAANFSDGRLLGVSPDARMLAVVLESLAENSGVLRLDPYEIRAAAGMWLADEYGTAPTVATIQTELGELEAARWLIPWGDSYGYLHGFGGRQVGPHVSIGVKATTGEIMPHLPLPPCVSLELLEEKDGTVRRAMPRHCAAHYDSCPCIAMRESSLGESSEAEDEPSQGEEEKKVVKGSLPSAKGERRVCKPRSTDDVRAAAPNAQRDAEKLKAEVLAAVTGTPEQFDLDYLDRCAVKSPGRLLAALSRAVMDRDLNGRPLTLERILSRVGAEVSV
jgi:hypothetical protein